MQTHKLATLAVAGMVAFIVGFSAVDTPPLATSGQLATPSEGSVTQKPFETLRRTTTQQSRPAPSNPLPTSVKASPSSVISGLHARPSATGIGWVNFTSEELNQLLQMHSEESAALVAMVTAAANEEGTSERAKKLTALAGKIRNEAAGISAVVRRAVVAAVLRNVDAFKDTELDSSMRQLFLELRQAHDRRVLALHKKPSADGSMRRAPIYLLHISKAGGTSLCSLSHYNRCLEHPKANNCWIPGAGPVWYANFKHTEATCAEYQAVVDNDGLDIIANEGYLDGGVDGATPVLCNEFLYMTLVRHPATRVVSHMMQNGVKSDGLSHDDYLKLSIAERVKIRPDITNNYMTRTLLGKDAYYKGVGELTENDGNKASAILARFDMVLLLELKQHTSVLFETMLGWTSSDIDRKKGRSRHVKTALTPSDVQLLADANKLDLAVYQTAETLFKIDTVVFAAPHPDADVPPQEILTCGNPKRKLPKK